MENEHYQVISIIEIYQSLRRKHRYHKTYPPILILEFLKGCIGQLIKENIFLAFSTIINTNEEPIIEELF